MRFQRRLQVCDGVHSDRGVTSKRVGEGCQFVSEDSLGDVVRAAVCFQVADDGGLQVGAVRLTFVTGKQVMQSQQQMFAGTVGVI